MTLAQFALLVDAEPKWVLNALGAIGGARRYTVALARRLAVARAIHHAVHVPIARAVATAGHALRAYDGTPGLLRIETGDADVALSLDMRRILSSFAVRLSLLETTFAPAQRGRPRTRRRDALKAAAEWGIDVSLLAANLGMTAEARVRQLDSMAAFARAVHRVPTPARSPV